MMALPEAVANMAAALAPAESAADPIELLYDAPDAPQQYEVWTKGFDALRDFISELEMKGCNAIYAGYLNSDVVVFQDGEWFPDFASSPPDHVATAI